MIMTHKRTPIVYDVAHNSSFFLHRFVEVQINFIHQFLQQLRIFLPAVWRLFFIRLIPVIQRFGALAVIFTDGLKFPVFFEKAFDIIPVARKFFQNLNTLLLMTVITAP
jgi:hypothetical protein